eukprot:TRINITY_DN1843_c0_g1_i3.p1 TRINITY_DN1843_c0_g1~~TRINITY_DN1843_c0_g1_i3.p1  ORF type:complete len:778 (-),score=57.94 TRINITY_DN1843_c0_g1_i3:23-2356(-)
MHKQSIPRSDYYESWKLLPLDQKNIIDYNTNSCAHWCIKIEHLYAVHKLDNFNHVKSICLDFSSEVDPVIPQALNTLAQKLSVNTSIEQIIIRASGVDRLEIVDGLVNVLRALTTRHQPITRLDIRYTFHPSMHRSLLELLATHTSIKHLSLELNDMPRDTFKAIIETLMKSNTTLKTLTLMSIVDFHNEDVDMLVNIINKYNMKCTIVMGDVNVATDDGRLMALQTLGYTVTIHPGLVKVAREKIYVPPSQPTYPIITNDEHHTNVIQTMPDDMMQYILNYLDIKSLLVFKKVSKQIQSWLRTSSFWHRYYLSKASTIPTDVMTAADVIYGSYMAQNRSVNFWECVCIALTGSLLQRETKDFSSLNALHEQLVTRLLQTYPELRMMDCAFYGAERTGRWRSPTAKKWVPTRLAFYILGSSRVIYHLNFNLTKPDTVGVRFFHGEVSRAEEEWNPTPLAVYDWFITSSVDEIITRVKPMVEAMIVSMRSAHSYVYRHLPLDKIIDCNALPQVHEKCMASITKTFDKYAKSLLDELQVKIERFHDVKSLVEQFSDHVSSVPANHVTPDYDAIHHRVDRTAYNHLYQLQEGNNTVGYWNFEDSFLDTQFGQRKVKGSRYRVNHKKKERVKKTPHIALICLFRKVLNLVMLPVLKSLWLRNLNDTRVDWYGFDIIQISESRSHQNTLLGQWYDYYYLNWQPLESVTVSHAKPSSWPMSAIVVGNILAPYICEAVVAVVKDKWNGTRSDESKTKVDVLVQMIEQYDLFPKHYSKIVRSAFQ